MASMLLRILRMLGNKPQQFHRPGSRMQESHIIVKVLDGVPAAVVLRVVRHTSAMAMSRAAPRAGASFASSTGEPFHTCTPPCHTIAFATTRTLHDTVCDVGSGCSVAPCKPSGAHALRAIAPPPTGPAIAPSRFKTVQRQTKAHMGRRWFDGVVYSGARSGFQSHRQRSVPYPGMYMTIWSECLPSERIAIAPSAAAVRAHR